MTARRRARERWGISREVPGSDLAVHRFPVRRSSPLNRLLAFGALLQPHRNRPVISRRSLPNSVVDVTLMRDRRGSHPIDQLSREFDDVCTTAVDAHQIAASLEAQGINDRITRDRFAVPDVFALATELHQRVPLRTSGTDPAPDTTQGPTTAPSALMMRGPIYLVPVLFFVGGGDLLRRNGGITVALISLLIAWVWNQGFGVFIHRFIGRGEPARAKRVARQSLAFGTLTVTFVGWLLAHLIFGNGSLALVVGVQTAYLIGSSALLALSRDRLLMAALAPGAAAAGSALVTGLIGQQMVMAIAAATVGMVVTAMAIATRGASPERLVIQGSDDIRLALTHGLLGGAWALLIALGGYAASPDPSLLTLVSIAAAPLVMTMGVAEWQLVRLRNLARSQMAATTQPVRFAIGVRSTLTRTLGTYALSILAVAGVVLLISQWTGRLDATQFRLAVAFVFLGCAMFAGMLLVSLGHAGVALGTSAIALAGTALLIAMANASGLESAIAYGVGCIALCASLVAAAFSAATRPVVYR